MISIIITGHGAFASGMEQALQQIIGHQPQLTCIDFPEAMSTAQLEQKIELALNQLPLDDGVVFMTDLLGGTPFRCASLLSQHNEKIKVLTGTNLQMAAEMLLERDEYTLTDFCQQALTSAHRGITSLDKQLQQQKKPKLVPEEDGI
ncbi:PTS galactosamine/N-acetylgalactosamine transporter subunit IIA [Photobacterium iliopiscarium]|jgi:PTS system N-acetylgalactosamine-specific IIA component|uniref:PTS N-acetylgalactosamine transporter subunit IIA n=1 Tax=Photobacterium iliopiscarium TaxID=56192 RepID=A0A2T3MKU8_9GAMM|nr:PTS galactosamine/N-acetylgalactosamine transporter subunit IIA [Photobacterium iliopiscarium]KJG13476.1 PTS N-acetylgalactosamine transporter subunit IIA [Photobacterium iliopiscarium]PSU00095.1 PTS N-acetylgalactosamine transporter subunit IIA [Photobacterium iliopiscarium]PSV85297.1 PTS N-acetylgalactosamine transporter subunit IIA [Photobacterium iliopiscarium]PSV96856.1 PTS N-acetylgalactosamine transporter subunit IIA [Photobacterium iliopiscarium]